MKHFIARAGLLALLVCLASAGWAQRGGGSGGVASGAPGISKAEEAAYTAFYKARTGDPNNIVALGEAFVVKYPMSPYTESVDSALTGAYYQTNQFPKMLDAGTKALVLNPDDINVLPLLAFYIPRQVTPKMPDASDQLKKAAAYAHHGIELISSMVKPVEVDDATFTKSKNQDLYYCHSGLGTIGVKTGQWAGAAAELNQAVALGIPDMVDYYLLAVADEQLNQYTDATAAFTKCSANGSPVQGACKSGLSDVKDKAKNNLEAPK